MSRAYICRVLALLLLMAAHTAIAQIPEPQMLSLRTIGGGGLTQILKNVTTVDDGGFILGLYTTVIYGTGNTDSFCSGSEKRYVFVKYNADATSIEWSKCYGAVGDTSLMYLFPRAGGNNILGGFYNSSSQWGFYITKHDASDNVIWSHGFSKGNGLIPRSMCALDDGGFVMAGDSYYEDSNAAVHYGSHFDGDMLVMRLDSNGGKLWSRVIGGTGDESVAKVITGPAGSFYIVGYTASSDLNCTGQKGAGDVYIVRLDSAGNITWHQDLGGTMVDFATDAVSDGRGGLLISADNYSSDSDVTHHIGSGENIWIIDLDSNGHIVWNNCYGGSTKRCYPNSLNRAADGSIWIAGVSDQKYGEIDTAYGRDDAWFVHTDSVGNIINAKVLGSSNDDGGITAYPLYNGHVLGGGYLKAGDGSFASSTFYGGFDTFLAELAPENQTSVSTVTATGGASIYPNPCTDFTTIETTGTGQTHLSITDITGRPVYQADIPGSLKLNTTQFPKGIYLVQLTDDNGHRTVEKLLVQ